VLGEAPAQPLKSRRRQTSDSVVHGGDATTNGSADPERAAAIASTRLAAYLGTIVIALHHTGLTVSDLDRSLQFWCDALGGRLIFRQEREGGYFAAIVREPEAKVRMAQVELAGGGHRVELFQFDRPAAGSHRSRPADVGFAHICVVTCELDLLLARLEAAGGTRMSDPVAIDAGVNAGGRAVYVRDPDGHALEVLQPEQT